VTLSDPTGEIELIVQPEMLAAIGDQLTPGSQVKMTVNVRRNGDEIRLAATVVTPLEKAKIGRRTQALKVRLGVGADPNEVAGVARTLRDIPGNERGQIYLEIPLETGQIVMIQLPETYATSLSARQALKAASGVDRVVDGEAAVAAA